MSYLKKIAMLSCMIIVLCLNATSMAEAKMKMSFAWAGSDESVYAVGAKKFKELFEKYTHNEIEVKLYCCFKMGGEQEMFKKMQLGTLDATIIAQNNIGPFFPLMDLFALPYMFEGYDHAVKVLDGKIGDEIREKMLTKTGVYMLYPMNISFRNIYNSKKPINSLKDVPGIRYRVPKNEVMIKTYKSFGAEPTPLAWSETFTATQTGIVDGGDCDWIWVKNAKFYEVCKHYAITEHFAQTAPMLISEKFRKKLSPAQQDALIKAGYEAALFERKYFSDNVDAVAKEMINEQGVQVTRPDKTEFIKASKVVIDELLSKRTPDHTELYKRIKAAAK